MRWVRSSTRGSSYCTLTQNALASWKLIDQLTPHLQKDNQDVTAHVKRLQAILDTATVVDLALNRDDEARGHDHDHRQSPHGDSISCLTPLEEQGRRRDWDDRDLCDVIRGRDVRGRIENQCQECERLEHEQREERDYDYYSPYYDQPHRRCSPERGCNAGGVKAFSQDLRRVSWPMNFKPSGIEKYDGSTNPVKWLKVYQFAIEAVGGDSYVMANYLPVCLSSSARSWLLGLPVGSVHSWSHLYQLFTINFCAMCACLGVNWDLASIIQKKGESLWEFI
jgi:hypothetical protein